MSERILSFDVLRGWAILGNLMVHTFMLVSQVEGIAESNPENLSIFGFILMGVIVVFGHWRGLFLLISAAVHMFTMQRKLKKGVPRHIILGQELLKGFLLWLWAMFFYVFLAQWSISKDWAEGQPVVVEWQQIYHADQFANIAWAIMISAVVFYFLTSNEKTKKPIVGAIVFGVLGLLFVFPAPAIIEAASNFWGVNFYNEAESLSKIGDKGWWDYILRFFANQFVARESPLLPHFAYSAVGSILGIFMSQEKIEKKKFLSWGFGIAGFCIAFAAFWLFVVSGIPEDPVALADFHIHPTWFVFFSTGIMLIVILSLMASLEFNRKVNWEKRLKLSRWSRRAGYLSLTVYSLASIQAVLRVTFSSIFNLFGWNDPGFRISFGLPTYWTFILIVIEQGLWVLILWLWEKGKYIGSIDWFFALILKGPSKKGEARKIFGDLLDVKGKLICPTPISFVIPKSSIEEIHSTDGDGFEQTISKTPNIE
ncbi:MAG: hypothetical protein ACFFDW_11895 [Candidatus Thorarchaeota archaeon]